MEFIYSGKNKAGVVLTGEVEADDIDQATEKVKRLGVTTIDKIKKKPKEILLFEPNITEKDIVIFTRQFATMIDAGLALVQCLEILEKQQENKKFKKVLKEVKTSIEKGETYSDALKQHPDVFEELYANMIEAGEAGGILDTIMGRLSAYMEKTMALKKKVKGAMVYPAVVIVISFGVIAFLMIFVIPTFVTMFDGMGMELPLPTAIVMQISDIFVNYFIYMILSIGGYAYAIKRYYKTESGQKNIDTLMLKLPVVGPLIQKVAVAKFTRTMGTLLSSGVSVIEGLEITARTAGNKVVEAAILNSINSIKEGNPVAFPLKREKIFPPMVVQMIEVGEQVGRLDMMLEKIADFYDEEVDTAVEALTSLLEPAMMVFLGISIGFIVVAMYLPIFKMASGI